MRHWGASCWPALLVSAIGLALRVEHAITFDGPARGADYEAHLAGVHWMMHHYRSFDFTPDVPESIGYQPPLWYMLSGVVISIFGAARSIASLAVVGWVIRQYLLHRILQQALPLRKGIPLIALTISAFLPISVLTDGKVNPEGLHSTLFTIAAYWLWRMERESQRPAGIGLSTGIVFGAFAGLGVLTKATSGLLPLAAVLIVAWQAYRAVSAHRAGWSAIWTRLLRPNVAAGISWLVVAGWWCGPNLLKYGHPFPHVWDLDAADENQLPVLYRRPLGWALPFYWHDYLRAPMLESEDFPRPNLWAQMVTGTWSDLINRGFCRLQGGGVETKFWDNWPVSGRCIHLLSVLAQVGLVISVLAVLLLLRAAWGYLRSDGRKGSLALPTLAILGFTFTAYFTLSHPFDNMGATNARYLLPISVPLAACLAIALDQIENRPLRRGLVALLGTLVAVVALLVTYERWGS